MSVEVQRTFTNDGYWLKCDQCDFNKKLLSLKADAEIYARAHEQSHAECTCEVDGVCWACGKGAN